MGKNDIAVKQWLSAKDRFADLFNMLIFGGSTVVHPQDLEDMEGEADIFVPDKAGGESGIKLLSRHCKAMGKYGDVCGDGCGKPGQDSLCYASKEYDI